MKKRRHHVKNHTCRKRGSYEIELESLIVTLRKQFEQEYCDTENLGQEILEGLEAVRDDRVYRRDWREVLENI